MSSTISSEWTHIFLNMDSLLTIKALSLLIAASLVSVSPANDEITRLLADLSFGDAVTVDESAAVSEEASQPVDAAVDVEEAWIRKMKWNCRKLNPTSSFRNFRVFGIGGIRARRVPAEPAPKAVLNEPVAESVPQQNVDSPEVMNRQPLEVALQPVETTSVGHREYRKDCAPQHYQAEIICQPRYTPNLPTSTFLQYFRGNPCYSNVWAGYRYDCGPQNAHMHGACGCLQGKNNDCAGCDSKNR